MVAACQTGIGDRQWVQCQWTDTRYEPLFDYLVITVLYNKVNVFSDFCYSKLVPRNTQGIQIMNQDHQWIWVCV